jgi:hypothetical protein
MKEGKKETQVGEKLRVNCVLKTLTNREHKRKAQTDIPTNF